MSSIRYELKLLIQEKQKNCQTEEERNNAENEAKREINKKYGSDWKEKEIGQLNKLLNQSK